MAAQIMQKHRFIWGLGALLCCAVAIFSCRYFFGLGPTFPVIDRNLLKAPWLYVHIAGAVTALLIGPFQFLSHLRSRFPAIHRWMGRTYVASCLIGGGGGLVLAFGASTGPISSAGFGLLAATWIATTSRAWRTAVTGYFVSHRAWMIRSFALTCSAVTLRIYLPLLLFLPVPFVEGYRAISFLCWVPNLIVAEVIVRYGASHIAKS